MDIFSSIIKYIIVGAVIVVICIGCGLAMSTGASSSSSNNGGGNSGSNADSCAESFWWPIEADENGNPRATNISSPYGYRVLNGEYGMHYGIDISEGNSPKIIATYDGVVDFAGNGDYGTSVFLKHEYNGETIYSIYGHMVSGSIPSNITEGAFVTAGTVLGTMGSTGNSTGVHLHFELRVGGWSPRGDFNRNPLEYVDPQNPYPSKSGTNGISETEYADVSQTTTMLVNEWSTIQDNSWVPENLVNVNGTSYQLQSEAAKACEKLMSAAASDGVPLSICSAYRSFESQNSKDWKNNALIAAPNATEHRTGLAVDFNAATNWGKWINKYNKQWKWLCKNAKDYGFILRYPLGCKDKTGIHAESWHWRYIGVENAQKFYEVAEQKGTATTPAKENGNKMEYDESTNDTTTYYKYTYEEFYQEYINK